MREKISHGQTVHFGPHSVRHIRKAEHLRIKNKWLKFDFRHPMERQIFGDGVGLDPALILALCPIVHCLLTIVYGSMHFLSFSCIAII